MRIVHVGLGEEARVQAAHHLFDKPSDADATVYFLANSGHHLLIAYDDERPAGFVTGVEMTHPDKGTEMFLYELGVEEQFRGRGIGKALVAALVDLAHERHCYGMWVLTDGENEAALATYEAAGGRRHARDQVMLQWIFDRQPGPHRRVLSAALDHAKRHVDGENNDMNSEERAALNAELEASEREYAEVGGVSEEQVWTILRANR